MMRRTDWKHRAFNTANGAWPTVLFVGTQAGCRQALKDCGVASRDQWVTGLDRAEYSLAATGVVSGKAKAALLKRRHALLVG